MIRNVDEYIGGFPEEIQERLNALRSIIKNEAPEAKEMISYNMPAYKINDYVVFFAAFRNHIGFYPLPSGIEKFKEKLTEYKFSRGSVQFPHDKPLPFELIREMVKFRVKEDLSMNKA